MRAPFFKKGEGMLWIHGFEVMCYILAAMLLVDMIRKRDRDEGGLFLSAALAGFALELLAVRLTDIYHYSDAFYIVIGPAPYQFPFFGGLMWGGVAVCAARIAKKFPFSPLMRALFAGWLVVSMDLLLDVAAIRLDGGFWIWEGRPINLAISHHLFMSVVWVNFLGYLFETPALVYMSERRRKRPPSSVPKEIFISLLIGAAAVAVVGILSAAALFMDGLTDEWFSCVAFLMIWCGVLFKLTATLLNRWKRLSFRGKKDWVLVVFWTAMYAYCLAGLWSLGVIRALPAYGAFGLFLGLKTLALCLLRVD